MDSFRRYVYRKHIAEKRDSTSDEVLCTLIKEQEICSWISPGTALRLVVDFYRTICLDSMDIERVMSAFTYIDSALTQSRSDDTMSKLVILKHELPKDEKIFEDVASDLFFTSKDRRCIP